MILQVLAQNWPAKRIFFHILFLVFAVLVVHVCQRLVEHASRHIEPEERRVGISRATFCMGCLVWALDVTGFLMYPWADLGTAHLIPALFGLVLMILLSRLLMPYFIFSSRGLQGWLAAGGLALSVPGVHLVVASALGRQPRQVHVFPVMLAFLTTLLIAGGLSSLHRSRARRRIPQSFSPLTWPVKLLAALAILLLHHFLDAAMPLQPTSGEAIAGTLPVLLILVIFAVVVGADQVFDLGAEQRRWAVLDRALTLLRSAHVPTTGEQGQRLSQVAHRCETVLRERHFSMHFQPIVSLREGAPKVRFEALMRVDDPELGRINPELFFLACERRGITPLADRTVIQVALEASLEFLPHAHCKGVAVNVAPATLLEPGFADWVNGLLKQHRSPWQWLQLEITEHAAVAASRPLLQVVAQLREVGVGIYLDDFGSGFSSLGLLSWMPISGIKCDRSLLSDAHRSPAKRVILEHVCHLGRELQLGVTVEGVEASEDLDMVLQSGGSSAQGYWLGRPMPTADAVGWLAVHPGDVCSLPQTTVPLAAQIS